MQADFARPPRRIDASPPPVRSALRSWSSKSSRCWVGLVVALGCADLACAHRDALPRVSGDVAQTQPLSIEQAAVEAQPICVGSAVASAGVLADTLYYRAAVLPDGKLAVGYYAFFSEERPWGNNWLTWTVVPALAVDMVYSHGFFIGPGVQRVMSGKGDVEGFRVLYELRDDGRLSVESAEADDGSHRPVRLSAADVLRLDAKRPTFYSEVWSHQLGGRNARSMKDLAYVTCYGPGHVVRLRDELIDEFALAGRAPPAHVEALGGRAVGADVDAQAKVPASRTPM